MPRIKVAESKEIYYEHFTGTGPAIVLLHGWGMNTRAWDDVIAHLCDQGRQDILAPVEFPGIVQRSIHRCRNVRYSHNPSIVALRSRALFRRMLLQADRQALSP